MLCAILLIGLNTLEAQSVKVGDLMTFSDGSKGIVCYVDPENEQKGWVVDLNDLPDSYQLYTAYSVPSTPAMINRYPSLFSLSTWTPEGLTNTTALYLMNDGSNYSPAAQAVDLESGWYIPDAQQMTELVGMAALLQPAFTKAGGNITLLVQKDRYYWTSTRSSTSYFFYLKNDFPYHCGYLSTDQPTHYHYIRRVRDFNLGHNLQTYWGDDPDNTTLQLSPSADTSLTALVIYGPDTFEIEKSVFVHPTFNKDTVYGDTVYIGIPYYKDFHNVTFHVTGPGNDTIYDTLKTVYGCDSIQTVILRIRQPKELFFHDTVCQSQVNSYAGPYQSVAFAIFGESAVDSLVKASGFIYKEKVYMKDGDGNDSTVNIYLTVTPRLRHDTSIVTTYFIYSDTSRGVIWYDSLYTAGTHSVYTQLADDGCDLLDVLKLVIIDVDNTPDTTCSNTPVKLSIPLSIDGQRASSSERTPHIGDVLCTDGTTVHPDSFLVSGKTAMGVVASVDMEEGFGRAIALNDAVSSPWLHNNTSISPITTFEEALMDMDGATNTQNLLNVALSMGDVNNAIYVCYYYNHYTNNTGSQHYGWYLPAAGELQLIFSNRVQLNQTLMKIGKPAINGSYYWSSTEYNAVTAWEHWTSYGSVSPFGKSSHDWVRPIIRFMLP